LEEKDDRTEKQGVCHPAVILYSHPQITNHLLNLCRARLKVYAMKKLFLSMPAATYVGAYAQCRRGKQLRTMIGMLFPAR
jgi:hypothetical protein